MARTEYEARGWGVGELWLAGRVVLAHDFDFLASGTTEGRVAHLGTKATFLDTRPDPAVTESPSSVVADVIDRVHVFLEGMDVVLEDVPIDLGWCTDFQRDVLSVLRQVPRGEIVTYGELAALAGHPGAQRAVGTICAANRYAFFVPCHRVVAADGIGGYGSAGVAVKRRLLALEGVSL